METDYVPPSPHARGTRDLGTGSRSLSPPSHRGDEVRTVYVSADGKPRRATMMVHRPFPGTLILIVCQAPGGRVNGRITRGDVLVRNRDLADRLRVPAAYTVYHDLHDALRAYGVHARDGYAAEAATLAELTQELLPEAIVRTLDMAGLPERQRACWERDLTRMADMLKGDRDEEKKTARQKLQRAAGLDDALGRHNPSAARARTMAATSRLRDRQERVPDLDAHCAKIAARLTIIGLRAVAMLRNLEAVVAAAQRHVRRAAEGKPADLPALARRLFHEAQHFASKAVSPYRRLFAHCVADLSRASAALGEGRLSVAAQRLDVLDRSLQLQRQRPALDEALALASRGARVGTHRVADVRAVQEKIESVRRFFAERPRIDDGFRRPVARDLDALLATASERIGRADVAGARECLAEAVRCL